MKKQLGFYVDAKRCIGCFACAMACKNQYHQASGVVWRQV
jgi:Fe-S-cluster-containing dehydrogenase component